jgi:putative acyl-CoA dehydrogenase
VTFLGAEATLIGEEGRGVPTIIDMVTLTRLDCVVSSTGYMRFGLAHALRHAKHRTVFQRKLADQPMMKTVLADLALDVEAATALAFRLARSMDRADSDPREAAYRRLMTPVAKYWICKSVPAFVYEAMECMGGNGYVEEGPMARLYREAPLNAIWEGSGNVMALDLLRGAGREPEAAQRVIASLEKTTRDLPNAAKAIELVKTGFMSPEREALARRTAEILAMLTAAAALAKSAPPEVAEGFAERRLGGFSFRNFGNPMAPARVERLIDRSFHRAA